MWLGRKWYHHLRDGDIILFYLIWYPLGRIIVEMFRPDAWVTSVPGLAPAESLRQVLKSCAVCPNIYNRQQKLTKTLCPTNQRPIWQSPTPGRALAFTIRLKYSATIGHWGNLYYWTGTANNCTSSTNGTS